MKFSKAVLEIHPSGIQVEFWKGEIPVYATTVQSTDWENALVLAILEMDEAQSRTEIARDDRSAEVYGVEESINVK
jgi:hypothetical protein